MPIIFDVPETNQDKIEFFKDELAKGKYQIDSLQIVEKLHEHHEFLDVPEMA